MAKLNDAARQVIESGALAHMVTLNSDGSPQVAVVWMGLDGDDLVAGHLDGGQRKLINLRRDPRVSISFEDPNLNSVGTHDHIVVHGTAKIIEGGAPELLNRLAKTYIGPEAEYPPGPAPDGFITHVSIDRISGVGEWAA